MFKTPGNAICFFAACPDIKTSASQDRALPSSPQIFKGAVHHRSGIVAPIEPGGIPVSGWCGRKKI